MKKLLILLKWKYSRLVVKHRVISFNKCLVRMHWIQQLEKLPQYDREKLAWLSYNKMRKLFIKEYPNEYLHK